MHIIILLRVLYLRRIVYTFYEPCSRTYCYLPYRIRHHLTSASNHVALMQYTTLRPRVIFSTHRSDGLTMYDGFISPDDRAFYLFPTTLTEILWRFDITMNTDASSHHYYIQHENGQTTEHNLTRARINSLVQRLCGSAVAAQHQFGAGYCIHVLIEHDIPINGSSFEQGGVNGDDSKHVSGVSEKVQTKTRIAF